MTLADYDPYENADYEPSESEDSDNELEFNSDASISENNEVEDEDEILVKEELQEEDAKIKELFIYFFFFLLVAPPGGCKSMCLLDCNQSSISHSRSPDPLQIGALPPPRPESELLANPGGHGVVVKMETV